MRLTGRAADGDVAEADVATRRFAAPTDDGEAEPARGIWLLRLRALLAEARGDAAAYAQLRRQLPGDGDNAAV
jgi:hypothetical protein